KHSGTSVAKQPAKWRLSQRIWRIVARKPHMRCLSGGDQCHIWPLLTSQALLRVNRMATTMGAGRLEAQRCRRPLARVTRSFAKSIDGRKFASLKNDRARAKAAPTGVPISDDRRIHLV